MSEITTLLTKQAEKLQTKVNDALMVKSASVAVLIQAGLSLEKAASAVDAEFDTSTLSELSEVAELLTKVAAYLDNLETRATAAESVVAEVEKKAAFDEDPFKQQLRNIGFTDDEIQHMSDTTIEKVAHVGSIPVGFGSPAGVAREKTDPMLEFLLS